MFPQDEFPHEAMLRIIMSDYVLAKFNISEKKTEEPENKESRRRRRQPTSNDVICECGRAAVVRTSRTALNPNRKFFCCAKSSRKGEEGCGLFEWHDVRVAIEKERQRLDVEMTGLKMENARLQGKNDMLKEDNNKLLESIAQLLEQGSSSGSKNYCACCNKQQQCCWDSVKARLTARLESMQLRTDHDGIE